MVRIGIALSICAAALLASPSPADACGIKIASSAPRTRKLTSESERPSRVLLVGEHSRRTVTVLFEAGHSVDVADDVASARGRGYQVVVTDSANEDQARQTWPGVIVVSADGSSQDVLARIELELGGKPAPQLVARRPIRNFQARRPRATSTTAARRRVDTGPDPRTSRAPVATGGSLESGTVSVDVTAASDETPDQGTDESSNGRVAAATERPVEETAEEPAAQPEEKPRRRSRRVASSRLYFKNASSELSARVQAKLARKARWLVKHPNRNVTIEGHTNTVGPAQLNEELSEARAESVKAFLLAKGVDESRIDTESFGMTRPAYKPGSNPRNRRVVLVIRR
jgi:outer membrane protein OmpA-like peptidoglycan-associated protein